jgi:hypothetical protein
MHPSVYLGAHCGSVVYYAYLSRYMQMRVVSVLLGVRLPKYVYAGACRGDGTTHTITRRSPPT